MTLSEIVAQLDAEIGRLQEVKALLNDLPSIVPAVRASRPGPKPANKPSLPVALAAFAAKHRRSLSPEARARISAAQTRRWAKSKRAAKKAARAATAAATALAQKKAEKGVARRATVKAASAKVAADKVRAKGAVSAPHAAAAKKAAFRKKQAAKSIQSAEPPSSPSPQLRIAEI